jgi:hypothetical protein
MFAATSVVAAMLLLASAPPSRTPAVWKEPRVWQFYIVDNDRKWMGAIVLEFTNNPFASCTDGNWQQARLISSSTDFFKLHGASRELTKGEIAIAYLVDGVKLWIDLNANLCEEHFFLQGELSDTGSSGQVQHYNFFTSTKQLGWFTALPAKRP